MNNLVQRVVLIDNPNEYILQLEETIKAYEHASEIENKMYWEEFNRSTNWFMAFICSNLITLATIGILLAYISKHITF